LTSANGIHQASCRTESIRTNLLSFEHKSRSSLGSFVVVRPSSEKALAASRREAQLPNAPNSDPKRRSGETNLILDDSRTRQCRFSVEQGRLLGDMNVRFNMHGVLMSDVGMAQERWMEARKMEGVDQLAREREVDRARGSVRMSHDCERKVRKIDASQSEPKKRAGENLPKTTVQRILPQDRGCTIKSLLDRSSSSSCLQHSVSAHPAPPLPHQP
jgi:hypothetical protein